MRRWRRWAVVAVAAGAVVAGVLAFGGSDGGGGGIEAFCKASKALRNAVVKLDVGPRTAREARQASRAAQRVAEAADEMRDNAPERIAADVEELAEVSIAVAERLREHYQEVAQDPDRAENAEFLSAFEITPEEERSYGRASDKVRPVIDRRCGVRARPTATTASTAPQGQ